MADIKGDSINRERERFTRKYTDEFAHHVLNCDLASILLKGHVLAEHYLDHAMVLIFDRKANIKNKSFYNKILQLKDANCFIEHDTAIACLLALNEIRYDLAHQPGYQLSLTQIDAVGYHLGREYILQRYAPGVDERKLLLWVLGQVTFMVYHPIWAQALENHEKTSTPANNGAASEHHPSGTINMNGNT